MAEDTNLEIEEVSKSKSKLIIIIAAVLLIVGAVAGYFLLSGGDEPVETLADDAANGEVAAAPTSSSATVGSALYVAMPRPFIFNVPGASRDRIVQIKVQLLVRGDGNEETAKKHIPLIEGTLLSAVPYTHLRAHETKAKFVCCPLLV